MRRAIFILLCASCGTGGATGGPPTNVPFSGAAGYAKVNGDYVLLDSKPLTAPALLTDSPDGPYAIWMTRGGTEIWRVDLDHLGTDPSPLRMALAPTEPWEMGSVANPSVERDATGFHMAYEAAGSVIALADSTDGESWTGKRMLGPGHAPALVHGFVFYDDGADVWRAPVGSEPPVHALAGTNPDVHLRQTAGERPLWQMFFNCTGRDQVSTAICYAASYDGENFTSTDIPILQPDLPSEIGPSGFIGSESAVVFFAQTPSGSMSRIAAATAP